MRYRTRQRGPLFWPDPDLLGGFRLLVWFFIFMLLCSFAEGRDLPPAGDRTVTWYAANPWALEAVTRACRDDPGRLRATRDCINADQARIVVAEREARANRHDTSPPTSPSYWARRPLEREQQLAYCGRMTAEQQARFFCDAARAAAPAEPKGRRT